MKNKSFIFVVAFCMGLQVNTNLAGQNQGWADWFRSKFSAARAKTEAVGQIIVQKPQIKTPLLFGAAVLALSEYPSIFGDQGLFIGATIGAFYSVLISIIVKLDKKSRAELTKPEIDATKETIKTVLSQVIGNSLLYPTRSSKIHALLKKDEFLQYVNDTNGFVQEACNELISEINSVSYSEEQKTTDNVIDQKMAAIKGKIIPNIYVNLQAQMDALMQDIQQLKSIDIPTMQAYLSVYWRLLNKLAVESKLSPGEIESRQSWSKAAAASKPTEREIESSKKQSEHNETFPRTLLNE